MVKCSDCETLNSVDSKFCKFCGVALPEEELVAAQVKLTELLNEGFRIFNEGRTEEAMLIANSALEESPKSVQALSLKAMCFERDDNLPEALELYENIVELNPDSALDKIKVSHLRNRINAKVVEVPPTTRKTALIAAVATILLVIAGGSILAITMGGGKKVDPVKPKGVESQQEAAFQQQPTNQQSTQPTPQPDQNNRQNEGTTGDRNGTGGGLVQRYPGLDGSLPSTDNPGMGTTTGTGPIGPVTVDPKNITQTGGSTQPNGNGKNPDGDPKPENTTGETQPKKDTATYEITVHNGGQSTNGGSDTVGGANELQALIQTARQQMAAKKYDDAVRTYEKALRIGGDRGSINQRLGQCFEHLKRTGEAINAYTKAVDAYRDSLTRTNSPSIRKAMETCENALRTLRG